MVNITRDFEKELLHEIKWRSHCKITTSGHFCTQRELSKNLKMTPKSVGPALKSLVDKGLITHDYHTQNHHRCDKFEIVDPKMYDSKEIVESYKKSLESKFSPLESYAKSMRENPALTNVKYAYPPMRNYTGKTTKQIQKLLEKNPLTMTRKVRTSKINKRGFRTLENFCELANEIFSMSNVFTYAQIDGFSKTEEINEELNELRENTYKRIKKIVWSSYDTLEEQQQIAIIDLLKQRIHTLADVSLITRLDKMTR